MSRTSYGYTELELLRRINGKIVKDRVHCSNIAVRAAIRDSTIAMWAGGISNFPDLFFWPWRLPPQWDGGASGGVLHRAVYIKGNIPIYGGYSAGTANSINYSVSVGGLDPRRYRLYQSALGSSLAARVPHAAGALLLVTTAVALLGYSETDNVPITLAATDIPLSSIGVTWVHPVNDITIGTTVGQSYITGMDLYSCRHSGGTIRIDSGPDKGVYLVHHSDRLNSRVWLLNMDGTLFVASATNAALTGSNSGRYAQMNEVSVVPNSKGAVLFDGHFDPGENRTTYLIRLRFEKSGSPSPSDASQKGSYWFGIRPWLHGSGRDTAPWNNYDIPHMGNSQVGFYANTSGGLAYNTGAGHTGHGIGAVLDRPNQRLWMLAGDGTNGGVYWWRYKSPECFHEAATNIGTAVDPVTGVTIPAGTIPRFIDIGSDNTVYVSLANGVSAGWASITSGLVGTTVTKTSVGLAASAPFGLAVDRSRYRLGEASTVTTSAATGNILAAGGAFTSSDVGRAIKITGGADAGTYLISVVTDATHVTVTTLVGGAVSFTGQAATGTWQIGDRIYLFFADATTSVGKLYYFESLAFGVLLQRTVTMTNGVNLVGGVSRLSYQTLTIDQATGCLYWTTSDVTYQVNRFDPAQASPAGWSRRLLTDFSKVNDASQNSSNAATATGMVDPTYVSCMGVNPHVSFREMWIGTDAGWIKLNPDNFAGTFSRYWGTGSEATPYQRPVGNPRPDGSWSQITTMGAPYTFRKTRWVGFGIDGRVLGVSQDDVGTSYSLYFEWLNYHREADVWTTGAYEGQSCDTTGGINNLFGSTFFLSPYGEAWVFSPNAKIQSGSQNIATMHQLEIHYQFVGGVWVPKEVVRGSIPGALSPGLAAKDLHTSLDDLIMGVKVEFTPQGGATPANSEFLGRLGAAGVARADGAWQTPAAGAAATQVLLGSSFVAGNVGDYVWISASAGNGASIGAYQILAFTNGNTIVVRKISNLNFAPGGDVGPLTYQVWSMGDVTLPGPENVTCILGHGIARDNTQDITNIYSNFFLAKTLLSEQQEGIKFCVDPPGPPGSPGMSTYFESYPYSLSSNYSPGIPQGMALPGAPLAKGLQLVDGAYKFPMVGVNGGADTRFDIYFSNGRGAAQYSTTGFALSVDLGASAEVGSIIVRGTGGPAFPARGGAIINIHNAPDGAAPAAASVIRTSGTNLSITGNLTGAASLPVAARTVTLSVGDFLGSSMVTGTNGQTSSGGSRLTAIAGAFSASHLMCVVKLTTGVDIGSYRIINVAGDGSYVDVRNLDQTSRSWAASATGLAWDVRDAVQADDIISCTSGVKMTVERLLSTTTAEVRLNPHVTLTNVAWSALKPTWPLVKRVSNSVMATPPDVAGNRTYATVDGCEESVVDDYWKVALDLSDLPTAKRSGRYWKFSALARSTDANVVGVVVNSTGYGPSVQSFELYDLAGKLLTICKYNKIDTVDSLAATYLASYMNRIDGIMASNTAASHVAGANGPATVGGTGADTLTLAGGNTFLGFEVRRGVAGSTAGGVSATWTTDSPVAAVDVGRTLHILSGPNAGMYRISTVIGSTGVTVTTNSGAAVTFTVDAGPTPWAIHEAISTGMYVALGGKESSILTISDDFKSLVIADRFYLSGAGVAWEVRWRTNCTPCDRGGNDQIGNAWYQWYPLDATYFTTDARGTVAFHPTNVGNMPVRNDGGTTAGTANFTGSLFTPDDVGRLLILRSGTDIGRYEIATYVSPTAITVKNLDTGGVISFTGTLGSLPYLIQGERRFRVSRYITVLRS